MVCHRREPLERDELLLRELPELLRELELELLLLEELRELVDTELPLEELLRELVEAELPLLEELLRELVEAELPLLDELLRELVEAELPLLEELLRELVEAEELREVVEDVPVRRAEPSTELLPRDVLLEVLALAAEPERRVLPVVVAERLFEVERLPAVAALSRDDPVREVTAEVTAVRRFSSESTLTMRRFSSREGTLT